MVVAASHGIVYAAAAAAAHLCKELLRDEAAPNGAERQRPRRIAEVCCVQQRPQQQRPVCWQTGCDAAGLLCPLPRCRQLLRQLPVLRHVGAQHRAANEVSHLWKSARRPEVRDGTCQAYRTTTSIAGCVAASSANI